MSQTTVSIGELWDITSPPPPRTSQLYHLEPIGLGTPFVESLSSYILRLAQAHHVLPIRLAHHIQSCVAEKAHFPALTFQTFNAVNSNSGLAQRWVAALARLTLRQELHLLTMLPWANVFATTGLMHRHLVWCPNCFQEWRETGIPLSLPLLWLVSAVSVCLRHQKPLCTQCPFCRQEQPAIAGTCWLGYCAHCGGLLDGNQSAEIAPEHPWPDATWEQKMWVAHSLGTLLAATPTLNTVPDESTLECFAQQCVTQLGHGNMRATARLLGIPPGVLSPWQRCQGHRVNVKTFFSVCFHGGIAPLEAIVYRQITVQSAKPDVINEPETSRPKRYGRRKHLNKEKLARDLDTIIAHNELPPPTVHEVTGRLGCCKDTLIRHFPQQYRILRQRHQAYKAVQLQAKREKAAQIVQQALTEWPPPTTEQVAKRVGYTTGSIFKYFYPQFKALSARSQTYKEAQAQEKIEHLRRALTAELDSSAWPPPTTKEIVARLQCPLKLAYRHCPEQCHALAARHLVYRAQQKEKRIQAIQASVRLIVHEIYAEGRYPSRNLLTERLPKPNIMLCPDAREAYQQTLRDLGYDAV